MQQQSWCQVASEQLFLGNFKGTSQFLFNLSSLPPSHLMQKKKKRGYSVSWIFLCCSASFTDPDRKHWGCCDLPPAGSAVREVLNSTSTILAAVEIENPVMTVKCEPWNIGAQRLREYSALSTLDLAVLLRWRKKAGSPSLNRKENNKVEENSCMRDNRNGLNKASNKFPFLCIGSFLTDVQSKHYLWSIVVSTAISSVGVQEQYLYETVTKYKLPSSHFMLSKEISSFLIVFAAMLRFAYLYL